MKQRSKIFEVENKERRFGSAKGYVAIFVGRHKFLFTEAQIKEATERAEANAEDFPKPSLFNRFKS